MTYAPPESTVSRVREHLANEVPPEHFYVELLGLRYYDMASLHERVTEGLPFDTLETLQDALACPTPRFAALVGIPLRTLARRKEANRLQSDESDRLFRLARIAGLALKLFAGGLDDARAWLFTPLQALGGHVPLDLAVSEVGAREVEKLIGRIEHGIPL